MHCHEIVKRSAGGDPCDPRNVVGLCYKCHLAGAHRQSSPVSAWFRIRIVNPVLIAEDEHGIAFDPWKTKAETWRDLIEGSADS
jgi:hypothetical protein